RSNIAQHLIAHMVAIAVVQGLEMVNVNHEQRELLLLALGALHLKLKLLLEIPARLQASKVISKGEADQAFVGVFAGEQVFGEQCQDPQQLRVLFAESAGSL